MTRQLFLHCSRFMYGAWTPIATSSTKIYHAHSSTQEKRKPAIPISNGMIKLPSLAPEIPFTDIKFENKYEYELNKLKNILQCSSKVLIITGAGISTESGIPDYRSPVRMNTYKPLQFKNFMENIHTRKRYWARSMIGYIRLSHALPNDTHYILSKWKSSHLIDKLITQNVDSLHIKSGWLPVLDMIEMHGHLRNVQCMQCKCEINRDIFQQQLISMNENFAQVFGGLENGNIPEIKPDGDIDIDDSMFDFNEFQNPVCRHCLTADSFRPRVVFFGENLMQSTSKVSVYWAQTCDLVIVLGSTLQTHSSLRLVQTVKENQKPVIIVNIGETRGDDLCDVKIDFYVSKVLNWVNENYEREVNNQ